MFLELFTIIIFTNNHVTMRECYSDMLHFLARYYAPEGFLTIGKCVYIFTRRGRCSKCVWVDNTLYS